MIKSGIERAEFIQKLMETFPTLDSKLQSEENTEIINQLQQVKQTSEKLKNQLENKSPEIIVSEKEKDEIFQTLMKTFPTLESKLSGNISQAEKDKQKMERLRNELESTKQQLSGNVSQAQEEKQKMEREMERLRNELESTKQQLQQEKQAAENLKKQLEEKNHELQQEKNTAETLKNQLEDKNPELSGNISQAQEEKQKMERLNTELDSTKQQKGDIILDEVDGLAPYICLRNTSSEDKMMTGWELKLQINNRNPVTYKFERNFTLKAGEGLTLYRFSSARRPYPDNAHLRWADMSIWNIGDNVKISLISNTGEEHRLM